MGIRILLIRGGGTGDVLLATTVIKALRRKFPDAHIAFATELINVDVLMNLQELDEIIGLKDTQEVLSFSMPGYEVQYSLNYEKFPQVHILDAYGYITGLDLSNQAPVIVLNEEDRNYAQQVWERFALGTGNLVIGLHRGPTWPIRTWPDAYFRDTVRYFKEKYAARFIELSVVKGYCLGVDIDLSGQTSLRQLAAVLEKCSLVLCIDSLIMHLASTVSTPVVAIFGGTDPDKRLPRNNLSVGVQADISCHGCHHREPMKIYTECRQSSIRCMESLSPNQVIEAGERLLLRCGLI